MDCVTLTSRVQTWNWWQMRFFGIPASIIVRSIFAAPCSALGSRWLCRLSINDWPQPANREPLPRLGFSGTGFYSIFAVTHRKFVMSMYCGKNYYKHFIDAKTCTCCFCFFKDYLNKHGRKTYLV